MAHEGIQVVYNLVITENLAGSLPRFFRGT